MEVQRKLKVGDKIVPTYCGRDIGIAGKDDTCIVVSIKRKLFTAIKIRNNEKVILSINKHRELTGYRFLNESKRTL